MLDPKTIRIGDRVLDAILEKAGLNREGSIAYISDDRQHVRIVWDWCQMADLHSVHTWYLKPKERPPQ